MADLHQQMKGFPLMGVLNCIVVEDNNKQSALLKDYIAKTPKLSFSGKCGSAADLYPLVTQHRADIIFWDPFSPRANPSLWTIAAFRALRATAGPRCTLVTYSASTATRVALLVAGWAVGVGDPIGDKAQTTAAAVAAADLARPLDRRWLDRLTRADAPRPSDAPADFAALCAAQPQFA